VILSALGRLEAELSIRLVSDPEIERLAGDFGRARRPTDVLAFPTREGVGAEFCGQVLGDVVISVPTAARQAQERGASIDRELRTLLAHGILHLLGMDHETDAEAAAMRFLELHLERLLDRMIDAASASA